MDSPEFQNFYQTLQKNCLPGTWSKGLSLARDGLVLIDSTKSDEIILKVKVPDRPVSLKVSLWPLEGDYFCDCDDRADPCVHVAGAVAALKNGLKIGAGEDLHIRYRFVRSGKSLLFERWLGEKRLQESVVALVGAIGSGRIKLPRVDATQDDFNVDRALGPMSNKKETRLDRVTFARLFPVLRRMSGLVLDGKPTQVGHPTRGIQAELRDDNSGFRLLGTEDTSITEVFDNGVLLCGHILRILEDPGLTAGEKQMLSPPGRWFSPSEVATLISEVIPALEKKIPVTLLAKKLPQFSSEIIQAPPQIELKLEKIGEHTLGVTPVIRYPSEYSAKNPAAEHLLLRKLQNELHLVPGQRVEFNGMAAIQFIARAQEWEMSGEGKSAFALDDTLEVDFVPSSLNLSFRSSSGRRADPDQVFRAWKEQESHVPLLGGGYAPLPTDWLKQYGSRISRFLEAREANQGELPTYLQPELVEVTQELGGEVPDTLVTLKNLLENFDKIPEAPLPKDLQADLRHYQKKGINWLCFLRDSGLGALLADDMGLGKTLQAMCAIQGRTLVVTPTSVLHSWAEQLRKFRPGLTLSLYYGPNRKLDPECNVTLTSYGLLRQDKELLLSQAWDTAILDEAQIIKNPESQVAQAAHLLKANFRMTLSGTPVENSMEDLWSQFRFLNPGLFGSKQDFQTEFSTPVSRGDEFATHRLRTRIKPFILRRMKREVAPELPPRTEVVLRCELSQPERELYDALLTSSRQEVLEKLEKGGSVLGALELLLRLRQACCHPSLVPGQNAETSAKLELLTQTLESSLAQGHRALIFSQWTSFLDLIGPRLEKMGLTYLRLDGTTRNREEIVRQFQDPAGPPVMLLSLKAGGVGLTLTAADHVFLMDSWWNPAVEDQAADRAHRIGQENAVLVCRIITENTVEERILELQKRKLQISGAVLEGAAQAVALTRADILALLN